MDFRTLDRDTQPIVGGAPACEIVARLHTIADLMATTDKVVAAVWPAVCGAGAEADVQTILTDFDFLMRSRDLRKFADAWQDRIDAETT